MKSKKGHNQLILDKQYFEKFFKSLAKNYKIFGPAEIDDGNSLIEIDSLDKIKLDYRNTRISPKGFFFPETETLFTFDVETKKVIQKETEEEVKDKNRILFGIRPCDALAISFLDKVFYDNEPVDPYYTKRRNSISIISFACTNPRQSCFCTSVGCGPDGESGSDIIFFEMDGRYLIKTLTPEGEEILKDVKGMLKVAMKKDIEEKERLMKKAKDRLKKIFDIEDLEKKVEQIDASCWEELHQKCLGCGICTYLCPTCHCFDITDEVIKSEGRRVRTWDSCMFPLFTLHASGHNPRPTLKERMRQRIMHKFNYAPKDYGETFCVGCGRCIIYCPVNMDIREIIKGIVEEE